MYLRIVLPITVTCLLNYISFKMNHYLNKVYVSGFSIFICILIYYICLHTYVVSVAASVYLYLYLCVFILPFTRYFCSFCLRRLVITIKNNKRNNKTRQENENGMFLMFCACLALLYIAFRIAVHI